jgi:hypothetical protein
MWTRSTQGHVLLRLRRFTEAAVILREALELHQSYLPPEHADLDIIRAHLGMALLKSGSKDEGVKLLNSALEALILKHDIQDSQFRLLNRDTKALFGKELPLARPIDSSELSPL